MAKLAGIHRSGLRFQIVVLAFALTAVPALAQTSDARPPKSGAAAAAASSSSGDAGLKARVQALEEQLVDMQVVVGTLESLAKGGGSTAAPFPSSGGAVSADPARIEGLETQVRALSAQVQQLSDQVRSMGGVPRRSEIQGGTETGATDHADAAGDGFGSTTVSSGGDAIGGLLDSHGQASEPDHGGGVGGLPAPVATAALPAASETSGDPKQLYETAYGYLLQRDYGSAETAFGDFLKKFPNDSLSGNAQYWLGETYFVRGQYKAAAGSFLKGYQTYAQSGKAPDSLLKLAMSLDRLGQKDAACSSFSELATKFPTAPQNVKSRAQSERQRIGCQ